jgi:hypothetical protein
METTSAISRQRGWKGLVLWIGIGFVLALAFQLARRVFGAHVGGVVLIVPIAFVIVYAGMRRSQGASRTASAVIALAMATAGAAWFYVIGI